MTNTPISPKRWRQLRKMTMASVASMLAIGGKNPSRTWQRYETGEREPPVSVIARMEMITDRSVTSASWLQVRQEYLARTSPVQP